MLEVRIFQNIETYLYFWDCISVKRLVMFPEILLHFLFAYFPNFHKNKTKRRNLGIHSLVLLLIASRSSLVCLCLQPLLHWKLKLHCKVSFRLSHLSDLWQRLADMVCPWWQKRGRLQKNKKLLYNSAYPQFTWVTKSRNIYQSWQ